MTRVAPKYELLEAFRELFAGKPYLHRSSNQGDLVACYLYEDLFTVGKSKLLRSRISEREWVLNRANRRQGIVARRGDGTFGELIPNIVAVVEPGFAVGRGPIANVEIGAEMKILAKAMIKQIDRVRNDLVGQVAQFKRGAGNPICVGIVGINHADHCIGYEGTRAFPTDGSKYAHPFQEAAEAEKRLRNDAAPAFDEFLFLRYRATNEAPYPFKWVDYDRTFRDYGAVLTRISRTYDSRFGSGPSVGPGKTGR
ncbi:MAG: hypothetical protein HY906_12775 [Deltaproteobacteria bacterium]|nr:hypothetical protein [Deltaproteobacteria bacterium]